MKRKGQAQSDVPIKKKKKIKLDNVTPNKIPKDSTKSKHKIKQKLKDNSTVKSDTSLTQETNSVANTHTISNKKKKKRPRKDATAPKPPKAPHEFSTNWVKLLQTNVITQGSSHPKKPYKQKRSVTPKEIPDTNTKSATTDIWFDDVDPVYLGDHRKPKPTKRVTKPGAAVDDTNENQERTNPLVKPESYTGLTKELAMDCEMVGVGRGGEDSILARVSIVNKFGHCVYDKFVKPTEKVTDYRTHVSGVRPSDVANGTDFKVVQKDVSDMLQGRILVGHALHNDLKVLFIDHPKKKIRDTQRYRHFRALFNGRRPGLKKLTEKVLGVPVQEGEHSSVQDAQATMRLYTFKKQEWEREIKATKFKHEKNSKSKIS